MHTGTGGCPARAIRGEDVAAQAQTGTGKTAAFLISLFTRMSRNPVVDLGNSPQASSLRPPRARGPDIP